MLKAFVLGLCAIGLASGVAEASDLQTRYGILKIDDTNLLFFQGVPVKPRVEGNSFLSFEGKFEFPNYDLVLVQDTGGTACPAQYYVIRVSRGGAVPSKSFGTCSDLIHVTRMKEGLLVNMPGFMGPFEGRRAHERAARQQFAYSYRNGTVVERRIR
jgi:hypothetical protein